MPVQTRENIRDWPLWHFAALEAAVRRGDRKAAAKAIRRLEQLGIEVRFTLPVHLRRQEVGRAG
jgi:hypothetical protein